MHGWCELVRRWSVTYPSSSPTALGLLSLLLASTALAQEPVRDTTGLDTRAVLQPITPA